MKYDIIEKSEPDELATAVNERISKGWIPLGGVSSLSAKVYSRDFDDDIVKYFYQQAMILEEK